MDTQKNSKIPLFKALGYIFLITLFTNGGFLIALKYYQDLKNKRQSEEKYQIVAIVQATDEAEPLKTMCLAEMLGLSCDQPLNLYRFNAAEGVLKLCQSAIIKEAKIQKILPGTLYIEYCLRHPIAYLADYTNTVIDEEGIPFPHKPYLTPKNLPEIALGLEDSSTFKWGEKLPQEKIETVLNVLETLKEFSGLGVEKIDFSKTFLQSEGQSEIIFKLKSKNKSFKILRIKPHAIRQSLQHFIYLDRWMSAKYPNWDAELQIVDLRIQGLGYIGIPCENRKNNSH